MAQTLEQTGATLTTHDAAVTTKHHSWFNRVVITAILINFLVAAWLEFKHDDILEMVDTTIVWFFVAEVTIKIWSRIKTGWGRWRGWSDFWLVADILIVGLAALPLGENLTALRILRIARFAHLMRHLPHITGHLRHLPVLRLLSVGKDIK
jgi:hypothetical protein